MSTIAWICDSWLCTPPGEEAEHVQRAPGARAVSTALASTGFAKNSPVSIACSMRV